MENTTKTEIHIMHNDGETHTCACGRTFTNDFIGGGKRAAAKQTVFSFNHLYFPYKTDEELLAYATDWIAGFYKYDQ